MTPMAPSVTASRRLEWLQHQRESTFAEITSVCERAAGDNRDLTDAEQTAVDQRREQLTRYDAEIETEAELARGQAGYLDLMATIGPPTEDGGPGRTGSGSGGAGPTGGTRPAAEIYRSAGEYLVDAVLRHEDSSRAARIQEYLRAAPDQLLADNPGVVPTPIVGPVWNSISSRRPAIEAATIRPLPGGGRQFTRPHVTQHTLVGTHTTEKTALPSRPLRVDPITCTKLAKGGWVNLSWEDRDWTDPAIMDLLVIDLAGMYAQDTDLQFCTDFAAAVTQTENVATGDAAGWLEAIFAAAGTVMGDNNRLPTTLWTSVDVWASLGSLVDSSGRPVFPTINPVNGLGRIAASDTSGDVMNFLLAVDAHFAAGTAILGDRLAVEFFEQQGGQVRVDQPSVMGTDLAFYGYMSSCVVEPAAFVKLVPPAPVVAGTAQTDQTTAKSGKEPTSKESAKEPAKS